MNVTELTTPIDNMQLPGHDMTDQQFYDEINSIRAEIFAEKLRDTGLISDEEYDKLLAEIHKIFVPYLSALF